MGQAAPSPPKWRRLTLPLAAEALRLPAQQGRAGMPWTKTDNVAMYGQADWSGWVRTVPNCTPQQAQRLAMADPAIRFFFFCREFMVLTNPAWPEPKSFQPGDAVFFTGEPWF